MDTRNLVSVYYNGIKKSADIRVNGAVVNLREKAQINDSYTLQKINESNIEIKDRRNGKIRYVTFAGATGQ